MGWDGMGVGMGWDGMGLGWGWGWHGMGLGWDGDGDGNGNRAQRLQCEPRKWILKALLQGDAC